MSQSPPVAPALRALDLNHYGPFDANVTGGYMAQYIILTRVSPEAVRAPEGLLELEKLVKERVSQECPDVSWVANYAVMGPYDYLDVFEAPDNEQAMRVSTIIRSVGNATTELWPATDWSQFRDQVLQR